MLFINCYKPYNATQLYKKSNSLSDSVVPLTKNVLSIPEYLSSDELPASETFIPATHVKVTVCSTSLKMIWNAEKLFRLNYAIVYLSAVCLLITFRVHSFSLLGGKIFIFRSFLGRKISHKTRIFFKNRNLIFNWIQTLRLANTVFCSNISYTFLSSCVQYLLFHFGLTVCYNYGSQIRTML